MGIWDRVKGLADPITLVIIVACIAIGTIIMVFSKQIDSPAEQVVEAVLHVEGIDVDFSAEKKEELAKEQADAKLQAQANKAE